MRANKQRLTCIIVDDETPSHSVLGFYLPSVKWLELVGNCYNAFDGIELIRDLKPDIVFLDVTMPVMTGPQMLEQLPSQDFRVVMITANPKQETDIKDHKIRAFLYKPVKRVDFIKAVNGLRPVSVLF